MYLWKPLLAILPAGLALGAVGGHMAKPVLTQRVGDEPWQAMFQSRAVRDGPAFAYPEQPQGPMDYDGGFSYAPAWAEPANASWSPPTVDGLVNYAAPLPTVAELDARQAALLADPDKQYAVHPPAEDDASAPQDGQLAAADPSSSGEGPKTISFPAPSAADNAPEPPRADGEPSIW